MSAGAFETPASDVFGGATGRVGLCDRLIAAGKLAAANAERALRLQQEEARGERIGAILVKLGFVSELDLAENLARHLGLRLIRREHFQRPPETSPRWSSRFLREHKIVVVDETPDEVTVVMPEPQNAELRQALAIGSDKDVVCCLGLPSEIDATIAQRESDGAAPAELRATVRFLDDVEQLKELAGEAPIIKLVNQIIRNAAEVGASDIHIEPFEARLQVRYRIDGLLREIDSPAIEMAPAIISRIKIMANLDIAERRLAQDGRFRQRVRGSDLDLRVSVVPTMHGESVVLRLLRRDHLELDFDSLGFSAEQRALMEDILAMPHGIMLVTGPTGSGKTTTLYAALRHLNTPERMIITVEDPIEYSIAGINQMQAKPQIGLTFANALRSIVRQDPDVIMIGEMRDRETAEIAVQSALTGHLVLSTLHTNDAPSSVMRLLDMGVPDFLLTAAVNAVQAQRLVRRLCHECREPYVPVRELADKLDLGRIAPNEPIALYRARGCATCGGTGYVGRTAILEIVRMSDEIKRLVLQQRDLTEIARTARAEGMVPMRDDGLRKAVAGLTSVEEVLRVTAQHAE